MILKEKLLKTGYFIDNEYLDDYINLVVTPPNTNSLDYTEIHHILQKQYFKIINIKTVRFITLLIFYLW